MYGKRLLSPFLCLLLTIAAVATPDAQRGGGAGRGGGPGGGRGGAAGGRTGKIERITIQSKALEGNLLGDSTERAVSVYLPPTYGDETRRFPVLYLLHGAGGKEDTFTDRIARLLESGSRLSTAQGFSDVIVVTPDGSSLHTNTLYASSPAAGDWERFIAEELVAEIDKRYRTLPVRLSRGIAGHGAGGYGALRIAMKRPGIFSSLYVMSACCVAPDWSLVDPLMKDAEAVKTREQAAALAQEQKPASMVLALGAAWSPSPSSAPLFLELPVRNGAERPDVRAKWAANTGVGMLESSAANLQGYYAIAMDVGTGDPLLESNRQMHQALRRLHVPHSFEEYDGDHTSSIRERLESRVLTFFSKNLVATANPTSPQIKD